MNNLIEMSVVIVTFNGKFFVDKCIKSVFDSNKYKSLEVVVVDNGSNDGTVEWLLNKYASYIDDKKFRCISLDKNYGPAMARNIGVKNSSGKYIGFLDNDTVVDKLWADEALKAFKKDQKLGIVQCKLLLAKQSDALKTINGENKKTQKFLIDYVGEYLGQNGFLVQLCPGGEEYDIGQYNLQVEILAAKSAGMFITRSAFEAAGGFDADYFIYVEETDMGWRSWLAGYKSVFVPRSIVYHEFGTSALALGLEKQNYNAKFHGCKNYILSLFKNLDNNNIYKILPWHILMWIGMAYYSLLMLNPKGFIWIHKAIFWNVLNINESFKKRKVIQNARKISDKELFKEIMLQRSFVYYLKKLIGKKRIGNAMNFSIKR